MSLLDKASIISIPIAYDEGTYNNAKPQQVIGPANEVTNGSFDYDLDWTLGTKWSISGGKLNSVGTASIDVASQDTNIVIGKTYKVQYTISEYALGGVRINLGTANGTTRTDDGTYIEYITCAGSSKISFQGTDVSNTMAIDNVLVQLATASDFTFSRSSVGTRINEAGLVEEMAADIPRINYENGFGALLLEPQSTNLCTQSSNVDNWSNLSNVTATSEYDYSPTGDFNANRLQFTANGYAYHNDAQVASTEYTISVWAKRNDDAAQNVGFFVDSVTGTIVSVFDLTDRWQRFTYTYTATNTGYTGLAGLSGADISFYGFQREALPYATSLIETSGSTSAVTRTADECNNAGSAFYINSTEGAFYAELSALYNDGTNRIISLSDGTSANVVSLLYSSTANELQAWVRLSGILQAQLTHTLSDVKSFVRVALKYRNNEFGLWVNGENVAWDYAGSVFSADTLTSLDFHNGGGLNDFYGNAKSVIVFEEFLSDTEMRSLTGGNLSNDEILSRFRARVSADGGIFEGSCCVLTKLESLPEADEGRRLFDIYNGRCIVLGGSTEASACTIAAINNLL
jgi:hypothetical protein